VGQADHGEAARLVEGCNIDATRLDAETLQGLHTRGPEVEPHRLKTPFLGGEEQRAAAEANIKPGAQTDVARDALDDACRDHAALLEGGTGLLAGIGALEDLRRDLGCEVAVGENVTARLAAHPGHERSHHRTIERMA